ncbi:MAG TPA: alpha-amylase family glycosyl hydrolase [Rhizomicrobium sp.]|nr:alpha-amylase family glycosyl hydrolase [Rhizomicrobium sp.]
MVSLRQTAPPWWRGAVIYQVYVRSFCDSNSDGQGDFAGLIGKLDYIAALGVDAIWLSPIHPSPNRDWGYDVSDYETVHPDYGTLADFHRLVKEVHARGLKLILDEVLAHTSDEHAWFTASRDGDAAKRDWPKKDWYVWADPKDDGSVPNNWLSVFGGPAWSYQPARRQYYHHKFLRQQPKLSWVEHEAREAALKVLDLWLERGVDGYRLDVANAFLHDRKLTDNPAIPASKRDQAAWTAAANMQHHFFDSNLMENRVLLDLVRRRVESFNSVPRPASPQREAQEGEGEQRQRANVAALAMRRAEGGEKFVFGEFSEEFERSGCYLPPDKGLHAGYNFALLTAGDAEGIVAHLKTLAAWPDHWPCIAFSNHDVIRTVTRFGPGSAKVMLALLSALRGTILLYQGEELGLTEVNLRRDQLRDPVGDLYYPLFKGRDGCRTPMPWDAAKPYLGFSGGMPWLPPGPDHAALAVSAQEADGNSTLAYARVLLKARKTLPALVEGDLQLLEAPDSLIAFVRSGEILCLFNLGGETKSWRVTRPVTEIAMGTGGASLKDRTVSLPPLSAWFGQF